MSALELTTEWPVPNVAAAASGGTTWATIGDTSATFRLASLAKPLTAWAVLVAVEEGIIGLDAPLGQPGCTLRHLLAHAGGYPFEGVEPIAAPARTRVYSNRGIELAADAVAAASDMPFGDYLRLAVFEPLGMASSDLRGSPAHQIWSTVDDFVAFVDEVRRPTLVTPGTAAAAVSVHYPQLSGIVPGVGRYEECPWGLGFEIRGAKSPHWTGARNAPSTHGHFGGAGTMFWIDPHHDVAVVAFTDRMFDDWSADALRLWPEFSDAALAEFAEPATVPPGGVR